MGQLTNLIGGEDDNDLFEKTAINPGRGRKRGDTLDDFKNDLLDFEPKLEHKRSSSPFKLEVTSVLNRPMLKLNSSVET